MLFKQIKMELINKLRENFCLAFFKKLPGLCFLLWNRYRCRRVNFIAKNIMETEVVVFLLS